MIFRVKNSSKWPQKWCPFLGREIREILGVDLSTKQNRFWGKSQVFATKIFIFLENMMKQQFCSSPQKTVWFEQKSHVKLKISKQNQKRKISSFFLFHDKSLKSYTFSKKFIFFRKNKNLKKGENFVSFMSRKWLNGGLLSRDVIDPRKIGGPKIGGPKYFREKLGDQKQNWGTNIFPGFQCLMKLLSCSETFRSSLEASQ